MSDRPFDGQVALVTGARTGIGLGSALYLAARGATVILNSRTTPAEPITVPGSRHTLTHIAADVSSESEVAALIGEIERQHGRLNILVNSAGTTVFVPHEDLDGISGEDWHRILDVNVIGTWNVIKAAAPLLEASNGSVVNVSSMAGIRVTGSSLPYSVSKAALNQLTRTLARALGPRGIRVNAVAPGFVDTPWTADYQDRRAEVANIAPLRRVCGPEEIAEAIGMLIQSRYITGEIVTVDGGLTLVN
ncbi:MAG: SDR family NAD(P)-dependent oxidoreductase [Beutenbergiaceae bacterium]